MENEEIEDIVEDVEETVDTTEQVDVDKLLAEKLALEGRLKRAETKLARSKETTTTTDTSNTLSSKDVIAIAKSNISDEDIDEVLDFAKYKNISVSEALKSGYITSMVREKAEMRKTAEVTHSGTVRNSTGKVTADQILQKAERGELSENDMDKLVAARLGL